MKKFIVLGTVLVALLAIGGIVVSGQQDNKDAATNATASENHKTTESAKVVKACDLITLDDAKSLIGSNATLIPETSSSNAASTATVTADNCSYSADGATLGDMMQLTIQVQTGPLSEIEQAYSNYQKEYPGDALAGLGDKAYYATENNQAVVLKGTNWFFVGAASMNSTKDQNKAQAIKAASIAIKNL